MLFIKWVYSKEDFFVKEPCLAIAVGLLAPKIFFHLHWTSSFIIAFFCIGLLRHMPLLFIPSFLVGCIPPPCFAKIDLLDFSQGVRKYLKVCIENLYDKKVAQFYLTFFLGFTPKILLKHTFLNCGLSHLLAISGLHFQSLIAVFDRFFRLSFNRWIQTVPLLIIAFGYFSILDTSASVFRSFFSLFFALVSKLVLRIHYPKNTYFFTIVLLFFFDRTLMNSQGFYLSYLATFALLYPQDFTLKKRVEGGFSSKIKNFVIDVLKVNVNVCLLTLPYIFLTIGEFPLISLIMNLFFPLLLAPCMFLLIGSFAFNLLKQINQVYTHSLLTFLESIPRPLLKNITLEPIDRVFFEIFLVSIVVFSLIHSCVKRTNAV